MAPGSYYTRRRSARPAFETDPDGWVVWQLTAATALDAALVWAMVAATDAALAAMPAEDPTPASATQREAGRAVRARPLLALRALDTVVRPASAQDAAAGAAVTAFDRLRAGALLGQALRDTDRGQAIRPVTPVAVQAVAEAIRQHTALWAGSEQASAVGGWLEAQPDLRQLYTPADLGVLLVALSRAHRLALLARLGAAASARAGWRLRSLRLGPHVRDPQALDGPAERTTPVCL